MAVLSHEGTHPVLYGSWPIPIGAKHRNGYIARPDEAGLFPVVVVVPGLGGLGSFEKDFCRRLAREGFATVSVEMFESGVNNGINAYNALTDAEAARYLDEVHEFIISEDVDWNLGTDIGIFGADVGGRFAIMKAATRNWVKSVTVAYAPLTGDEEREFQVESYLSHLPVPVLALYGSEDGFVSSDSVDEAQRRNDHGQWLLYDGAGHGFLDIDAEGFDQSAADDAFARVTAFFSSTLGQPQIEDLG